MCPPGKKLSGGHISGKKLDFRINDFEVSLTRQESTGCYVIIRHNVRTYESAGVMGVVTGRHNAEAAVKQFENGQSSEDRHAGWRYFPEKTEIKAGTDPALATQLRQKELEVRESKALQEPDITPSR